MRPELKDKSRGLSKILRHKPDGYSMDKNGWVPVEEILSKNNLTMEELIEVVETNDKKRFTISDDKTKIRANQGHSIEVDVELKSAIPPFVLYHGTGMKFMPDIINQGIKKMNRQHVHLSESLETAIKVGSRKGKVAILEVRSREMNTDGIKFYLSENGVWLTDFVDPKYLQQFVV